MQYNQPKNLLDFLKDIKVINDGILFNPDTLNKISDDVEYFSYETRVSEMGIQVLDILNTSNAFYSTVDVPDSIFVSLLDQLQVKYKDTLIMALMQEIVLDSFTLIALNDLFPENATFFTQKDALRLHNNISYVANNLARNKFDTNRYDRKLRLKLIKELRTLDKDTSYIFMTISGKVATDNEL